MTPVQFISAPSTETRIGFDNLNGNQQRRDFLIFGDKELEYSGGTERFQGLTLGIIEVLASEGFLDPNEQQNEAPTIRELVEFMGKYPNEPLTAHGYTVHSRRNDYRVSFEGLQYMGTNPPEELRDAFSDFLHYADEFRCNSKELFAWFD